MELAGRVFDVVTAGDLVTDEVRTVVPEISSDMASRAYWRRVLRFAALCHDIGHLSHAAEHALLPSVWSHERLGKEILLSDEMRRIFSDMTPPLRPEDVVKLALGPRKPTFGSRTGKQFCLKSSSEMRRRVLRGTDDKVIHSKCSTKFPT